MQLLQSRVVPVLHVQFSDLIVEYKLPAAAGRSTWRSSSLHYTVMSNHHGPMSLFTIDVCCASRCLCSCMVPQMTATQAISSSQHSSSKQQVGAPRLHAHLLHMTAITPCMNSYCVSHAMLCRCASLCRA
jgi:hypothetical protein